MFLAGRASTARGPAAHTVWMGGTLTVAVATWALGHYTGARFYAPGASDSRKSVAAASAGRDACPSGVEGPEPSVSPVEAPAASSTAGSGEGPVLSKVEGWREVIPWMAWPAAIDDPGSYLRLRNELGRFGVDALPSGPPRASGQRTLGYAEMRRSIMSSLDTSSPSDRVPN